MRARLGAAAAIAIASLAAQARAHAGHVVQSAERYLKIDATEADTRVVVSLTMGAAEGARVLESADADGDGQVSQAESNAYLSAWAAGLRSELPILVDGMAVEVDWTDGWLDPLGSVGPVPVTIEMVAHLPTRAREHEIALVDRMVRREAFDRTDVAFRAHAGAEILGCGADASPPNECPEPDLSVTRGAPLPTRWFVRVRYPTRTGIPRWALLASALTIATLALGGALALRSRLGAGARSRSLRSGTES